MNKVEKWLRMIPAINLRLTDAHRHVLLPHKNIYTYPHIPHAPLTHTHTHAYTHSSSIHMCAHSLTWKVHMHICTHTIYTYT